MIPIRSKRCLRMIRIVIEMCKALLNKLKKLVTVQSKSNAEGFVMESKQIQKAGDGSQQIQAGTVNVYGITEARAREIFSEMNAIARQSYTQDAYDLALKRVGMFEELLMQKVEKVNGLLEAFGDPSFQFLLTEAQRRAAASDRDADIEMLTELLAHRVEKKSERKIKASISKAVEIVDQIDDDALCALTMLHVVNTYTPVTGEITEGLSVLNSLWASVYYMELPSDNEWAQHLDILDAVRVSSIGTFKKIRDIFAEKLSGYVCVGIPKESDKYKTALELLKKVNLNQSILVDNELMDGYVRLRTKNKYDLIQCSVTESDMFGNPIIERKISDVEVDVINQIFDLYEPDSSKKQQAKNEFVKLWDSHEYLVKVSNWWDALPHSITITPIGTVLAHANAQRYNKEISQTIDKL